jgi:hypothetical protein
VFQFVVTGSWPIFYPWWWRPYVPPKRWFLQDQHGVISQRAVFFIVTAVKTTYLKLRPRCFCKRSHFKPIKFVVKVMQFYWKCLDLWWRWCMLTLLRWLRGQEGGRSCITAPVSSACATIQQSCWGLCAVIPCSGPIHQCSAVPKSFCSEYSWAQPIARLYSRIHKSVNAFVRATRLNLSSVLVCFLAGPNIRFVRTVRPTKCSCGLWYAASGATTSGPTTAYPPTR